MTGAVRGGIEMQMSVREFDAAVGLARDIGVVCNHEDGVAGFVQITEDFEDDFFVGFVEIAGRLIGEDELGLIDERASDGDALLLASGKLRGEMREAISEPDAPEGFGGLMLVGHGVEILREHDVFERREIGDEVELLEYEADFLRAHAIQLGSRDIGDVVSIEPDFAAAGTIEAADQIHQR